MAEERKVFADSVVPLPPPADPNKSTPYKGMMIAAAAPVQVEQPMTVHFSLVAPNEHELEERVSKGEILTPEDLAQNYTSDPDTSVKLQEWLTGEGFEIEEIRDGGASIYAKASADLIAKSLQVHMVRVTKDGLSYTAAADAPSLPSSVGAGVQAILGLSRSDARTSTPASSGCSMTTTALRHPPPRRPVRPTPWQRSSAPTGPTTWLPRATVRSSPF